MRTWTQEAPNCSGGRENPYSPQRRDACILGDHPVESILGVPLSLEWPSKTPEGQKLLPLHDIKPKDCKSLRARGWNRSPTTDVLPTGQRCTVISGACRCQPTTTQPLLYSQLAGRHLHHGGTSHVLRTLQKVGNQSAALEECSNFGKQCLTVLKPSPVFPLPQHTHICITVCPKLGHKGNLGSQGGTSERQETTAGDTQHRHT